MHDTEISLPGLDSPEAQAQIERMLRPLQSALRRAMSAGPAAAEDDGFWAEIASAYAAYDAWIALLAARSPFTCARGCSACCHDNPHGVAGVESLRLRRRLRYDGRLDALEPAIQDAARAWAAAVRAEGGELAMRHQRALHRPCPLLGPDGACTVYADRPVACRMFHALTPAAWCEPTHPDFERRQNPNLLPPLVCRQLLGAISRCLGLPASTTLWEGLATPG